MDTSKIIDIACIAVFAIVVIVEILLYARRGLFKTLIALANVVISFAVTSFLVIPIKGFISSTIGPAIVSVLGNSITLMESNSVLKSLVSQLPSVILVPAAFVLLYFIILGVLQIISFSIINKKFGKEDKKPLEFKCSWLVAGALSVIITAVGFWVVFTPITGTADVVKPVSTGISYISENSENTVIESLQNGINCVENSTVFNLARKMGTTKKFISLTAVKIGDNDIDLSKELEVVSEITEKLVNLSSDGELESSELKEIVLMLSGSQIATMAISETLRDASLEWQKGNEYLGVKMITGEDEDYDSMMKSVLESMSKAQDEDVPDVLSIIAEIIDLIPAVRGDEDNKEIANLLANLDGEKISNLLMDAYDNEVLASSCDEMLKYMFTKASKAANVDISKEIDSFSFAKASREDAVKCAETIKMIIDEASTFSDRIFTGEVSITEEEQAHLNEILKKCEDDKVIGEIAAAFVAEFESKQVTE